MSKEESELAFAALYPDLSAEECAQAEYFLLGYLDVVRRIFERVSIENPEVLSELEKSAKF